MTATNSTAGWMAWGSAGGSMGWEEGFWAHTRFGIAPVGTARVTVTDESGAERDLQITPWCGAFVAVVRGERSTLTGYDADGAVLDTTG